MFGFTSPPALLDDFYYLAHTLLTTSLAISCMLASLLLLLLLSPAKTTSLLPVLPHLAALNSLLLSISFLLAFRSFACFNIPNDT